MRRALVLVVVLLLLLATVVPIPALARKKPCKRHAPRSAAAGSSTKSKKKPAKKCKKASKPKPPPPPPLPPRPTPTPSPTPTPTPTPTPFVDWTASGTGFVKDLEIADTDGDGSGEVIVGGRGIGAIDADALASGVYEWTNKWILPDGTAGQGDWDWVSEMSMSDVTGDGAGELVVGAVEAPYTVDPKTGDTLDTFRDSTYDPTLQPHRDGGDDIAVGDLNGDGARDLAYADLFDDGITAVDVRNDTRLWFSSRQGPVLDLVTDDVNGDGLNDVVLVGGPTETGFEISALSGLTGTPLWSQPSLADPDPLAGDFDLKGDPVVVQVGQVVQGGPPEVVIGSATGEIEVLNGTSGALINVWTTPRPVMDLLLTNVDPDAALEIIATATDMNREPTAGSVLAYDGGGAVLWSQDLAGPPLDLELARLDEDEAPELMVGGGFRSPDGISEQDGFISVLDVGLTAIERVAWTQRTPEWISSVAFGEGPTGPTLAAGQGDEGTVFAFSPTGTELWKFRTGGRTEDVIAADLDGAGAPELVEVGTDSHLVARDAKGRVLWTERVPGPGGPDVVRVASGNLTGTSAQEVIVGTRDYYREDTARGRVHAYSPIGEPLWTIDQPGAIDSLLVEDVDANGALDILTATSIEGSAGRYTNEGDEVWRVPLDLGTYAAATTAHVNDDGVRDLLVLTKEWNFTGQIYALDGVDGRELWYKEMPGGFNWAETDGNRVLTGDLAGRVYELRPSDGETVWMAGPTSSSWDGGWMVDVNGDGVRDVMSAHDKLADGVGWTRVYDGSNGELIWEKQLRPETTAFQVATAKTSQGPVVATGGFAGEQLLQLRDARTGEDIDSHPLHSFVLEIVATDLNGDGAEEFVTAAGWNLHAVRAR